MTIAMLVKEDVSRYVHSPQKKIENPHDKFFKETFGHVEVTKSFLQDYLPADIVRLIEINTLKHKSKFCLQCYATFDELKMEKKCLQQSIKR